MRNELQSISYRLAKVTNELETLLGSKPNEIHFHYLGHDIVITPFSMKIGKMNKTIEQWELTTPDMVRDDWYPCNSKNWEENKGWLLELCKRHKINVEREMERGNI